MQRIYKNRIHGMDLSRIENAAEILNALESSTRMKVYYISRVSFKDTDIIKCYLRASDLVFNLYFVFEFANDLRLKCPSPVSKMHDPRCAQCTR